MDEIVKTLAGNVNVLTDAVTIFAKNTAKNSRKLPRHGFCLWGLIGCAAALVINDRDQNRRIDKLEKRLDAKEGE